MSNVSRTTLLHRTAAGLLLLSAIPSAKADCHFDRFNREVCDGLSNGARIGIGIGIFVLAMILLSAIGMRRRRRIQRANQAYITNPNTQTPQQAYAAPTGGNYSYNNQQYGQQQHGGYDPTNAGQAPQYPPPTHSYGQPGYNAQEYPQPGAQSPPQYASYAPPPGPPPGKVQ